MNVMGLLAAVLVLLIVANGAPILAAWLLGSGWSRPLDGGRVLADGRPLLGDHATWRGVVVAVVATGLMGAWLGLGAAMGAWLGLLAMMGDALSSFIKRRLGLEPGAKARGLDQIPEALLPLLGVAGPLGLGWVDILLAVAAFTAFDMAVSGPLYRLHLRHRPY